jgi:2-polyprenyl-6-hydroxyphenyl methylase/3-demethylubiquinone-9 3-methyltransferase
MEMAAAYYVTRLSGDRLRRCYERAPWRVKQYLDAEIVYVLGRVQAASSVLELGCGYGRVLARLAQTTRWVVGIDTSLESLVLARELTAGYGRCELAVMDATALGFRDRSFDAVVCIQNGICAFRVNPRKLLQEALRVTRPGGRLLFSSYSETFWPHRLLWFEQQAEEGLLGEIDYSATSRGEIVCKDGFRSRTLGAKEFTQLCGQLGAQPMIVEVDESSVFCEIAAPSAA